MASHLLIDILAYRDWAVYLADCIKYKNEKKHAVHLHHDQDEYCNSADLTFLIGWSQIVPREFYEERMVLVLHPSPLPKYRGGSPIQHQILAGELFSAVSLFKLDVDYPAVDSGPIYLQKPYTLDGQLSEVLIRIADISQGMVQKAIDEFSVSGQLHLIKQDESSATTYKRRTPAESQITLEEMSTFSAKQFHDKVRALQDPYPNAFIRMMDGSKLYITETHL